VISFFFTPPPPPHPFSSDAVRTPLLRQSHQSGLILSSLYFIFTFVMAASPAHIRSVEFFSSARLPRPTPHSLLLPGSLRLFVGWNGFQPLLGCGPSVT